MHNLAFIGRIFVALALIGLGIEHFIFEKFVTGRAPESSMSLFPGRPVWDYVSGVVIIVAGMAILTGKKARVVGVLAGMLIFVWAFLRHVPLIAADSFLAPTWTAAGKALTFFGGAFAVVGTLPKEENISNNLLTKFMNLSKEYIVLGQICLGIFMVIAGLQHFCTLSLSHP